MYLPNRSKPKPAPQPQPRFLKPEYKTVSIIAYDVFKKTYEEVEDTPPRKYKVWISSPDNNSFNEEDEFEVTNESEEEIEQIAKDFAFEHIEWGYEEFKGEVEDE